MVWRIALINIKAVRYQKSVSERNHHLALVERITYIQLELHLSWLRAVHLDFGQDLIVLRV